MLIGGTENYKSTPTWHPHPSRVLCKNQSHLASNISSILKSIFCIKPLLASIDRPFPLETCQKSKDWPEADGPSSPSLLPIHLIEKRPIIIPLNMPIPMSPSSASLISMQHDSSTSRRVFLNIDPEDPQISTQSTASVNKLITATFYCSNEIKSSKYTMLNFIPKNLFEQFRCVLVATLDQPAELIIVFLDGLQIGFSWQSVSSSFSLSLGR